MTLKINRFIDKNNLICFIALLGIIFTVGNSLRIFYLNWILGFILFIAWTYHLLKQSTIPKYLFYAIVLQIMWLLYSLLITPWVIHKDLHLQSLSITLFYSVIGLIIGDYILRNEKSFMKILIRVAVIWILLGGIVFIIVLISPSWETKSFSGLYMNRNAFAITTCIFLAIPVFLSNLFRRGAAITLIAISIILILASQSIKGFMGLVLLLVLYVNYGTKKNFTVMGFFAVILSFVILFSTDNKLRDRLVSLIDLYKDPASLNISESAYKRYELSQRSFRMIIKKPIVGYGINNSVKYLKTTYQEILEELGIKEDAEGTYSHNNYLEMLINGGILAFLLYYVPLFVVLFYLDRKRKRTPGSIMTKFILVLLYLKLFFDIGMVSYYSFIHCLLVALALITYAKSISGISLIFDKK